MGNTPSASANISPTAAGMSPSALRPFSRDDREALPIVPHYVYSLMALDVYREPDRRPIPPGWRPLMDSSDVKLDREGYFATAYVNDAMRHCVIAERGTADALGIRAGIWMYFDEPTIQFALADQFTKLVKLRLQMTRGGGDEPPYVLSFTGHSLGGVLAACQACREHTYAVTFENPGCRKFVDLTMHPFRADDVDIITYLRQPNPINTLRPHCGYLVQLPLRPPLPMDHLRKGVAMQSGGNEGGAVNGPAMFDKASSPAAAAAANASKSPNDNSSSNKKGTQQASNNSPQQASPTAITTAAKEPASSRAAAAVSTARRIFSIATPQEFLRSKLIEASMPELQMYLSRVEPVIKELLDHTQQLHSIAGIVDSLVAAEGSHQGQDVVLVWPSHVMQFLEYFNITREMADPANQDANLYTAYEKLLSRLYQTESRPKHKIPLRYINHDSQRLLAAFLLAGRDPNTLFDVDPSPPPSPRSAEIDNSNAGPSSVTVPGDAPAPGTVMMMQGAYTSPPRPSPVRSSFAEQVEVVALARSDVFIGKNLATTGLSDRDLRFLRSLSIQAESLVSTVCTAFEAKQYLAVLAMRPKVRAALDRARYRLQHKL